MFTLIALIIFFGAFAVSFIFSPAAVVAAIAAALVCIGLIIERRNHV